MTEPDSPLPEADFALYNVDTLVTVAPGSHPAAEGELGILRGGALASCNGKIVWVGLMDEIQEHVRVRADATIVNTHGRLVLPGFVDAHTHPVFAGSRAADFYARAEGGSYESGGIMGTVHATREASEDHLLTLAFQRAETFLLHGTTTIGAKTGYGLTRDDEFKSLRVLNRLQHLQALKVIPAFLGAHVVPPDSDSDSDGYLQEVIDCLPEVRDHALFVDVWCDQGAFTPEQCLRILTRAKELGFGLTAHANELGQTSGVTRLAPLGLTSMDHLVHLTGEDIDALKANGQIAVLLPATNFFLNSDRYAPARRLLDAGVPTALSTDFNPGTSNTQNMQFVLTLAVLRLSMTPEEALLAATINGARALGMNDRVGSLQAGKFCDFAVFRTNDYRDIPYHLGMNLVDTVVAGGQVVVCDGELKATPAPSPVGA